MSSRLDNGVLKSLSVPLWAVGGLIVLIIATLVLLGGRFLADQRDRDLVNEQLRLEIVLNSRIADLETWVQEKQSVLASLAENPGLVLVAGAAASDTQASAELRARAGFVRNLLQAEAEREGFTPLTPPSDVPANLGLGGGAGLALITDAGQVVAASNDMPEVAGDVLSHIALAEMGAPAIIDFFWTDQGAHPTLGFLHPVLTTGEDGAQTVQRGWILGLVEAGPDLFQTLLQPGEIRQTSEVLLVRPQDNQVEYISPLRDGSGALAISLDVETANLFAAEALVAPGAFLQANDYRGNPVLGLSEALLWSPGWVAINKVDQAEALANSNDRRSRLGIIVALVTLLMSAGLIIVWYSGTSRRSQEAARQFKEIARQLDRREKLLRLITDSQPTRILIAEEDGTVRFANQMFAEEAGTQQDSALGKSLQALIGPLQAKRLLRLNEEARDQARTITQEIEEADRVLSTTHIPISDGSVDIDEATLIVQNDITPLVQAQQRQRATMRQTITTLVSVVDRRDQHSADHSRLLSRLSEELAKEMQCDQPTIVAVSTAGLLLNLGKIFVPIEILTKPQALTEEEQGIVRKSLLESAELIKGIEFSAPVYETIEQAQERFDGQGWPRQLSRDDLLLSARILSVCNTFVALTSQRSHRSKRTAQEALDIMEADRGTKFDPNVLSAMVHFVNNIDGLRRLEGTPSAND